MNTGVMVKSGLGVAAVVFMAWASQQGYAQAVIANLSSQKAVQETPFLKNAVQWVNNGLAPAAASKVGEVRKEAAQQAQQAGQEAVDSAKKFVAQKFLDLLGVTPQELAGNQQQGASCAP